MAAGRLEPAMAAQKRAEQHLIAADREHERRGRRGLD
jgi:hypothetical protein